MRMLLLMFLFTLVACTPSANNLNNNPRVAAAPVVPLPDDSKQDPIPIVTPIPQPTGEPNSDELGIDSDPVPSLGCDNTLVAGSAHTLTVHKDESTGYYRVEFKDEADRQLQVISLYVTGKDDAIPIFPRFEFSGTAYWMVAVDNPFDEFFVLPVRYGSLPDKGIDVTEHYLGQAQGAKLSGLKTPTCLKFSAITFEPEEAESFKTSIFLQVHRP